MVVLKNIHDSCCVSSLKFPTVLILDSGVGGLFFYRDLRRFLPCVYYIYFFDNEAFPYGERSKQFILDRVIKIFKKVSQNHRLDLVILACNTITVLLLHELRCCFFFPIIGVVPDILWALQNTRNGIVGLLGTYRTINSEFISSVVNRCSMNYQISLLSSSELVILSEEKILYNKVVSISLLRDILAPWLNALKQPDTIILGCTHFLHLEKELRIIFKTGVCLITVPKNFLFYILWFLRKNGFSVNQCFMCCDIKSQAYCSMVTEEILLSWSMIIRDYGFSSLEKISI